MSAQTVAAVSEWSQQRSLELLGPEVMADIAASVAMAPEPSPQLLARVRRMFAAVPEPKSP